MPEYTLLAILSVLVTVVLELRVVRSGIFGSAQYWISMAIVGCFQVLVDGWLTKLSAPIVLYSPEHISGLRAPWDIPVEDFGFGFALVTLAMLLWVRRDLGQDAPGGLRTDRRKADVR